MARGKFQTLTEQMFYILLCLRQERCGADVMAWVAEATGSRVAVGPGTLYNLLEQFLQAGYIRETKVEGRKRSYVLTPTGREALEAEALGASYLIAGHIYATDCKKGLPARGTGFLRAVCEAADIPVYGIGGMHLDEAQIKEVLGCGAAGGCIMSGMMRV